MARNSILNAKAELYGLLASDANGTPVTALNRVARVYDHEPRPGDLAAPVSIAIVTTGMTPDFYLIAVRVYATSHPGAKVAQDYLDETIMDLDGLMTSGFGPSDWTVDWIEGLNAWLGVCSFEVGREDS